MIQQFIKVLLVRKFQIAGLTVIGSVLLFLWFWLAAPISYIAPVSILPPDNSKAGSFSSLLQGGDLSMLLSGSSGVNSQLYAQILKSRTVSLYVVDKNNLINYFGAETPNEAAEKLEKILYIDVTKEGILKLHVEVKTGYFSRFSEERDSMKRLSRDISLAYLESLDKINQEKLSSRAGKVRKYIEQELHKTKSSLDSAELALMEFQQKNRTLSVPDQIKATMETLVKVKAEIISTEIQIGLLEQNFTPTHSAVVSAKSKLEELKQQYSKLENSSSDIFVSFKSAPELGYQLTNLMRNVKILNEVYIVLQQQYYKELVQENRDVPTLDILDMPQLPEKEIAPRVLMNTAMGSVFLLITIVLLFYISEMKMFSYLKKSTLNG